jgi:hypothetical protein
MLIAAHLWNFFLFDLVYDLDERLFEFSDFKIDLIEQLR